jgi:hypothetical protein
MGLMDTSRLRKTNRANAESMFDARQRQLNVTRRENNVRTYGHSGTIHATEHVDVETRNGAVVSVWFRCQMIPFNQVEVSGQRADEMRRNRDLPRLVAVEVID